MGMRMRSISGLSIPLWSAAGVIAGLLVPTAARAQLPVDQVQPPPAQPAQPPPAQPAPAAAPAVAPAVAPAEAPKEEYVSDHKRVVGHLGIGWYGVSNLPLAVAQPGGTQASPIVDYGGKEALSAPAIGIRYWFVERFAIDAAIGLHVSSGSAEADNTSIDKQGRFGMLFHAGLPISLYSGKHVSWEILPELNVGFATSEVAPAATGPTAPPPAELSGFRLDVGARTGLEVHFGFMGLPELALEGTVGIFLTSQRVSAEVGSKSIAESDLLVSTSSFAAPWDIFRSVVYARYYL
jgi:hypothetical protein